MNIFVLDRDPVVAASFLIDRHMKLILEAAQMLCTTSWCFNVPAPYKITHKNHPCSIWIRESLSNYNWLVTHALAIGEQYTLRYGKIHKCEGVVKWCRDFGGKPIDIGFTPFVLAMPDLYKTADPVLSYRQYYFSDKKSFASWKAPAIKPEWWKD